MAQLAHLASRKEEADRTCVSSGKAVGKWSEEREGLVEEETGSEARRKEQEMKTGDWGYGDGIGLRPGLEDSSKCGDVLYSCQETGSDQAQASGVRRVRRAPLPVQSGQSGRRVRLHG